MTDREAMEWLEKALAFVAEYAAKMAMAVGRKDTMIIYSIVSPVQQATGNRQSLFVDACESDTMTQNYRHVFERFSWPVQFGAGQLAANWPKNSHLDAIENLVRFLHSQYDTIRLVSERASSSRSEKK